MWTNLHMPLSPEAERALFGEHGRTRTGFRKKLAAMDTRYGINLPPEFFGYGPDGKANDRGQTTIGIGTYRDGLRLVAIGSKACELLQDKGPKIHSALIDSANALVRMHVASGEHSLEFLPYERDMVIRDLCVGKAVKGNYWYGAAESVRDGASWMDLGDRKIPDYIVKSLMNQAMILARDGDDCDGGLDEIIGKHLPINVSWSPAHLELKNRLRIKLLSVGGQSWLKREHGCSLVHLHDVKFSIRANLSGPWFAGRMKIEARGELLHATHQRSNKEAEEQEADIAPTTKNMEAA